MIGTTREQTRQHLQAVAAQIGAATLLPGDSPGFRDWLRIPIPGGHVGVGDAEELGEHGLAVQAYEFADADENDVTYAGQVAWIGERAPVRDAVAVSRRYLATANARGSQVEQRQLSAQPQQPGLLRSDGGRVGSGQVP